MKTDITALLVRIKENIKEVEDGDSRAVILDEVRSDFLNMVELMKLFLISERDSYYGYFLMNMQFQVNFFSNSIAGIKLNTFPPVFEANPLLLCKFKLKEILYVMCHEIDHVVLNHPAEMLRANPTQDPERFYEFNLAADAAVNDRIDWEIEAENHAFLSRPNGAITSEILAKMFHLGKIQRLENSAYYLNLIERKAKNSDVPQNGGQSMIDEINQSADGVNDSSRYDNIDHRNEEGKLEPVCKRQIVTTKNCSGNMEDHNWEAGEDVEDAAAAVREFVNSSMSMMSEERRGLMPAKFMSQVEKLNSPQVLPWQVILKKYMGTVIANKRKSRVRLNRRQPERFDLSGSMEDKVLKIVLAIDTSASVNDQMLAKIFHELFAILAKRKHDITVIECDSAVQRVYKARTTADIKRKVIGRGGTLFSPVIEYINQDKYFRDALLIYFTDGYGEAEIVRPRTYRNMWVVIGDKRHLSLEEPYGTVLSF